MIKQLLVTYFLVLFCTISYAKDVNSESVVWIDVRSWAEHKLDGIEGDVHIPYRNIVKELSKQNISKESNIKLYCQSGGRSEKALTELAEAGYTKVENVGGIADARKIRGLE